MERKETKVATIGITPGNRFGQAIVEKCNDMGWDGRKLAEATELTYEALRKIINGASNTSPYAFNQIVKALKMDTDQMRDLVTKDRVEKKHGTSVDRILKRNPHLAPFESVIDDLTPGQRDRFLREMQAQARENRAKGKKSRVH